MLATVLLTQETDPEKSAQEVARLGGRIVQISHRLKILFIDAEQEILDRIQNLETVERVTPSKSFSLPKFDENFPQ